ncbi:MAG: ankyrin repeat domain-containing protein [Chthonomonadales bacterium]
MAGEDKASLIRRTLASQDTSSSQACNEILQMLIDHGADVNAQNPMDSLPTILAIESRQTDAAKFLIDHGVDVNLTTGGYLSPLKSATAYGNSFIMRLLLNAGADPAKCGTSFDELIDMAQTDHNKETLAVLKDAMAKRKAAGSGGLKK